MDYTEALSADTDIAAHLPILHELARRSTSIIELGVRAGNSTVAFLDGLGPTGQLWSVDVDPAPAIVDDRWRFIEGDDCHPDVVEQLPASVDGVFVDTSHEYRHTLAEIALYAHRARQWLAFHDWNWERWDHLGPDQITWPVRRALHGSGIVAAARSVTWHPDSYGLVVLDVRPT